MERGSAIRGWARVLLIRDLSRIMPESVQEQAGELYETWREDWSGLGTSAESVERITAVIQANREAVLEALNELS